jgi:hypothetical protein
LLSLIFNLLKLKYFRSYKFKKKMNGNQQQLNDIGTIVESSTQETAMASDDADLFDIKQRVKGMDEEAARLIQLQSEMEQQIMKSTSSPTASKMSSFYLDHSDLVIEKLEVNMFFSFFLKKTLARHSPQHQ